MSHTLLLEVPEDVYQTLAKTAEQIGQPPEALATQWVITATRHFANDPLEQFIGAFSSNSLDWADRHDEYLGQAVMETMHRAEREDRSDG